MADVSTTQRYNDYCYPEERLDASKKSLVGQTAAYALSIIAFIALIIVAIVLTSIFSPVFVSVAILAGSVGFPVLFGLVLGEIKTEMERLKHSIETEENILKHSIETEEAIEIRHLRSRIAVLTAKMAVLKAEETKSFQTTMKIGKLAVRIHYLNEILQKPTIVIPKFEEMFPQSYKEYSPDQMNQMIDGTLPYSAGENPLSWAEVKELAGM